MAAEIKVLIAEDNSADAELLIAQLESSGFTPLVRRAESEAAFLGALTPELDLIISDFAMPQFSGLRALELLKQSGFDIPFILVSGSIGEDMAVEVMKQGASDYLIKDRLSRLGTSVETALNQRRLRRERQEVDLTVQARDEQLRRTEVEFRLLFEANPMPMWLYEHDTLRFLAVNDAAIKLYGYSRDEFLAMTLKDIRPPEEIPKLMAADKQRWYGVTRSGTWRHCRKDGSPLFVEITYREMTFQGRAAQLVLANDLTERRVAESARRESDVRFQQLAQSIPQVFWLTDTDKRTMLYISPAYEKIWGRTIDSVHADSRSWLEAVHPDDRERVREAMLVKQPAGTYDEEFRIIRPDGSLRWINDKAFPIRDEQGSVQRIAGLSTDITERKELQEQVFRTQRLEAIGTLASGVAHDLNNILSPVLMASGLLQMRVTAEADRKMLDLIENAAKRGTAIIRQLLTFSRGSEGRREQIALPTLLTEIGHLVRQTFPKDITLAVEYAPKLGAVMAEASQIHQVLMNLAVNARDAMPGGGRILIQAENQVLTANSETAGGPHVVIRVADTGHGIPPAIIDRIFDPFFTTKEPGKGTGLGLSTVIGIVKSHGGFVRVESAPGHGTTFIIHLPAVETGPARSSAEDPVAISGRGRFILVVDDEAPIRASVRAMLEAHQFTVLEAPEGGAAIKLFIEHQDAVAAVVTDLMMPVMGGLDLACALRSIRPHLPIIACTGLDQEAFRRECAALNIDEILAKPFPPAELLAALDRALSEG